MTGTEARGGQKLNMTRWVLIYGVALVIGGLALIWILTRP
jgi:hypothetical protein